MFPVKRPIIYLGFNDPRQHKRGTENVILTQAEATTGRNYYVFRSPEFKIFRWQGLVAIGCPVNLLFAAFFLRRLVARVKRRKKVTPILHGHSYLLSAVASGAPQVFTVHDGLTYLKRHYGAKPLLLFNLVERLVYWRAAKIQAVSRYSWSEACGSSVEKGKLTVIANSTSVAVAESAAVDISTISSGSPEYLIVRSIEDRANLNLVLQLANHCLKYEPDALILVAGKGPRLSHYREAAVAQGLTNLHFLGYVSDAMLDALYRRATCVILTAIYGEGFGLPLIEAYARGTPAVGSDVCAVPEVIADPSLLFSNDLPALLAAIEVASMMPRESFIDHFHRNFNRDSIIGQYRDFYRSVR